MIEKFNFHWRTGFFYNFPKKRELFYELVGEIDSKQVVSIIGLRRTGKTTILKQLIDHLIKSGKAKREHILFYSFDEEQPRIEELLQEFEARLGKELLETSNRVFVFLDEIQKLENWQNQVKYYYDHYKNIKFFISGSSSLFVQKQAMESLAGRIYEFELKPLNFKEFLEFRGKKDLLKKKGLFQETLKKEFSAFQKRQFIEIVNENEERIARYCKSLIEKIVFQDIPKTFPIERETLLLKILKIVASNPGMLSDYGSMSRELGINRVTLSNYFYYLEESFLLKKTYNYSKNKLTSEKKMKKFYLTTTSLFPHLNNSINESKLVENLMVTATDAKFFWRTPQKYEVDIVLSKGNEILPVEVKYKELISEKDSKNLQRFCKKFDCKKATMVTKNKTGKKTLKLKNGKKLQIEFTPAWKFLLEQ